MNLYPLTDDERRILCRRSIESLEFWLRRLVHDELSTAFGLEYIDAQKSDGSNLIKNEIRQNILARCAAEPARFTRAIDASRLDNLIDIICNPQLYKDFFHNALRQAFPEGREEARTFLKRLEYPRNCLSHANPISVRQAEQVVCYVNDIIESLKEYYRMRNQESEFNVPQIVRAIDSFGNVFHRDGAGVVLELSNDKRFYLRVGETLTIDIDVDPTFDAAEYTIHWWGLKISQHQTRLELQITDDLVADRLQITCELRTTKNWHKYQKYDDRIHFVYKVLPPGS